MRPRLHLIPGARPVTPGDIARWERRATSRPAPQEPDARIPLVLMALPVAAAGAGLMVGAAMLTGLAAAWLGMGGAGK